MNYQDIVEQIEVQKETEPLGGTKDEEVKTEEFTEVIKKDSEVEQDTKDKSKPNIFIISLIFSLKYQNNIYSITTKI